MYQWERTRVMRTRVCGRWRRETSGCKVQVLCDGCSGDLSQHPLMVLISVPCSPKNFMVTCTGLFQAKQLHGGGVNF